MDLMTPASVPEIAVGADPRGAPAAITLRDLRVTRGGTPILHGLTLDVPAGCVYGLVGPSGSGKTTLIRALIGLQRIAGGEARLLGLPAGDPVLRPRIGYMPQEAAIYDDLSARENLAFFARVYRVAPRRIDELLALMDLVPVAERPVSRCSGGQRRRVALAAALLADPPLLLLDEPTVGLDPRLRQRLWSAFADWAHDGTTLVVSTHVMDEAAKTDRMAFLSAGRIVAEGSPDELRAQAGVADLEDAVLALTGPGEDG